MATQTSYPVRVEADYPERSSRLLALLAILFWVKVVLIIPHYIVVYVLMIVSLIVAVIGYWVVLFTGRYPRWAFDFILGATRWSTRMNLWLYGITDKYPPFAMR